MDDSSQSSGSLYFFSTHDSESDITLHSDEGETVEDEMAADNGFENGVGMINFFYNSLVNEQQLLRDDIYNRIYHLQQQGLTQKQIDDVISLVKFASENTQLPIPESRYMLEKEVKQRFYKTNVTFSLFCTSCFSSLNYENSIYRCSNNLCPDPLPRPCKVAKLYTVSLAWQLLVVLRNFCNTLQPTNPDGSADLILKLRINTDGAPLAKSKTGPSIWPVTANILNLPKHCRFHPACVILLGLWQGHSKPKLNALLASCFAQLDDFRSVDGVRLNFPGGRVCNVKITIDLFIGDAPVRSEGANMMGHAAYYACLDCFMKGCYFSGAVRYPYVPFEQLELRQTNEIAEVMRNLNGNISNDRGVKPGISTLSLYGVEIPHQTPPDSMHVLWEGVVKDIFDSLLSRGDYIDSISNNKL